MGKGRVDIYHSRRTMFNRCVYWNVSGQRAAEDIVMDTEPSGIFYAKEISPNANRPQEIMNIFMFDDNTITLLTEDNVSDMKKNSIVRYAGQLWRVTNISRSIHLKESGVTRSKHCTTFISLKS